VLFPKPLISTIDVQSAKPVLSTKGCGSARACALAIVFLSCCSTASAEVHTLTLRQALDFAAKQNADVLLARLDAQLAEQELLLASLKAELAAFEGMYLRCVGVLYAEPDESNARLAELKAAAAGAPEAKAEAAEARSQAEESYSGAHGSAAQDF